MAVQYLAANRFGLGRRFDDPMAGDPKDWLIRQIGDYDPVPRAIAGLAGREVIAVAYAEYRDERQAMRRQANEASMRDDDGGAVEAMRRMSRAGFRRHYAEIVQDSGQIRDDLEHCLVAGLRLGKPARLMMRQCLGG